MSIIMKASLMSKLMKAAQMSILIIKAPIRKVIKVTGITIFTRE